MIRGAACLGVTYLLSMGCGGAGRDRAHARESVAGDTSRASAFSASAPLRPGVSPSGELGCFRDGPAVVARVRDHRGRPAAFGASVVVRGDGPETSADGTTPLDSLRIHVRVPRAGRYTVRIAKQGYRPVVLRDVPAPLDPYCNSPTPVDTPTVTLELLPGAPAVRSVVVLPAHLAFGAPDESSRLRALVDADPGVSHSVRWTSIDTTVATVTADGIVRGRCQPTTRHTYVTAAAVAAPHVQGRARVSVERPNMDALGPASPVRAAAAACLARLRGQ